MAGTARDEAERLVAAVLAMAGSDDRLTAGLGALGDKVSGLLGSLGDGDGDRHRDGERAAGEREPAAHQGWATGSAECCVCPVCRAIAAVRDPGPETAVRLAMGAGDVATGVAGMMRAFSSMVGERTSTQRPPARPRPENRDGNWSAATRTTNRPGQAWSAATNTAPTAPPRDGSDPWSAATGESAARAAAEHAAAVEARAARRAAEQAAQREAARAAARRAREAAERVAEAVRLADAARDLESGDSESVGPASVGPASVGPASGGPASGAPESGAPRSGGRPKPDLTSGDPEKGDKRPRKRDVWAAATADAGVADVGGGATLDHDVPGGTPVERDGAEGDDARRDDAV